MIETSPELRQWQLQAVNLMKDVHEILTANSIEYAISEGSLIGAIRHNGFIPWDDDIDIIMDRKNLNKMLEVIDAEEGYKIQRELWVYRIRRENEIPDDSNKEVIDVLVMDNVPDEPLKKKMKAARIKILQGMIKKDIHYGNFSILYKICLFGTHVLGKLFSHEHKCRMYDRVAMIGDDSPTEYISCYYYQFKNIGLEYRNDILDKFELHQFEDTEFFIPSAYDHILTKQYGDYMTLPDEVEQVPTHIDL